MKQLQNSWTQSDVNQEKMDRSRDRKGKGEKSTPFVWCQQALRQLAKSRKKRYIYAHGIITYT